VINTVSTAWIEGSRSGRVRNRQDVTMSLKTEVFHSLAAALAPLSCSG